MSAGDGREGIIRGRALRSRLSGKLAGLTLPQQIITIAFWPFLEQVISFIVTATDLYVATNMGVDNADTVALSDGMGAIMYLMWLGFVIQGSIMMGATAIVSRMTGARDFPQAQHGLHQATILGLLAGLVSCALMLCSSEFLVTSVLSISEAACAYALQYVYISAFAAPFSGVVFAINAALRGAGDTRLPFGIMMGIGILNILLILLFVYGPPPIGGMRLRGIALGTVCAYAVSMIIQLSVMSYRKRRLFSAHPNQSLAELVASKDETYAPPLYLEYSRMKPDWDMQKRIIKIGIPQAIEVFGMWAIQMFCLSIISKLPYAGVVGVHNIAIRIESLSFLPGFAIGMAASTLVGQYLGAGNALMARLTIWRCMKYALYFMSALGVLFCAFPTMFMQIFADGNMELIDTGVPVLRAMLLVEPFFAACIIKKMSLRGAGATRRVMFISYGVSLFFRVGVIWAWYNFWPQTMTLWGIWLIFALEMAVQTTIFYRIVKGPTWTKLQV